MNDSVFKPKNALIALMFAMVSWLAGCSSTSDPCGSCKPGLGCDPEMSGLECGNDGGAAQGTAASAFTVTSSCTLPAPTNITPTRYTYGTDAHQFYDVYVPVSPGMCPRTVIVVCGGGFTACAADDSTATTPTYTPFAKMRAGSYGDLALSVSYRLVSLSSPGTNQFPAALIDVRNIVYNLWAPDPANPSQSLLTSLGGCDSRGVVLVGWSAGASLAALTAATMAVTSLPNGTSLPDVSAAAGLIKAVIPQSGPHDFASVPASDTSAAPPEFPGVGGGQTWATYFNSGYSFPEPGNWADGSSALNLPSTPAYTWLVMANPNDIVVRPWASAGTATYPLADHRTAEGLHPALTRLGYNSTFVASNDVDANGMHKSARIHLAALHASNTPQGCTVESLLSGL